MRIGIAILILTALLAACDSGPVSAPPGMAPQPDLRTEVLELGADTIRVTALSPTRATKTATNFQALWTAARYARAQGYSHIVILSAGPQGVDAFLSNLRATPNADEDATAREATVLAVQLSQTGGPNALAVADILGGST